MNQKALLVVSFGTTHADTREKTIDRIEQDLAAAFPDRTLYRAWTSEKILHKLRQSGVCIDTIPQALARMAADGVTDVLVQPTHMIPGVENDVMLRKIADASHRFSQITISTPLLYAPEDITAVAGLLATVFSPLPDDTALVLMGHGSTHQAGEVYTALDRCCKAAGHANIYIATVEGTPTLPDILPALRRQAYRHILLAPCMIVAGDHAVNDMAGEAEDSWKNLLAASGYAVRCLIRGLGEYPGIRQLFVRHALAAQEAAQNTPDTK